VIDLGLGEPDFPTPAHIIDAAHSWPGRLSAQELICHAFEA